MIVYMMIPIRCMRRTKLNGTQESLLNFDRTMIGIDEIIIHTCILLSLNTIMVMMGLNIVRETIIRRKNLGCR
jgi:hypothetical protein